MFESACTIMQIGHVYVSTLFLSYHGVGAGHVQLPAFAKIPIAVAAWSRSAQATSSAALATYSYSFGSDVHKHTTRQVA